MTLGDNRMEALGRLIVGAVFLLIVLPFVVPLLVIGLVVLGLIDISWQFITNGSGGRVPLMGYVKRVWDWGFGNLIWSVSAHDEFQLVP